LCHRCLVLVALFDRFESRGEADFANKIPSAMRKQFGGHAREDRVARRGATLADAPVIEDFNAALVASYQAEGALVADVSGAFDSGNFSQSVDTKEFGTIPLNVANVCAWTWLCEKPPHGPGDVHPNSEGHEVIAGAFEEVLPA
jgi:hypothetical protein